MEIIRHLALTNLSLKGSRGGRFIISDSAASYAKEMAGTCVCFIIQFIDSW